MPTSPDSLERLIGTAVRGLPPRRAPHTLETQVLAEIERRLALPWWRMSYAHWPAPVRLLFLIACAALIALVIRASGWVISDVQSGALANSLPSIAPAATSMSATIAVASSVARIIPPLWIYCGLGLVAVMYTTLFGIGATAYRTLYVNR
ncbi:MAG TPA: hypothetical protein VNQ81_01995 [Povalibacter sp.]|nr:hypothetical protein [Povalibacter sp.]